MERALASVYLYVRRLDTCQYIGSDTNATKGRRKMADKKPKDDEQHNEQNPWERFRVFVSKVAVVPKDEVEEQRKYERERDKKRAG